ncbi:MAG: CBS domain-containing protein [Chloroflexota bacterium]
MSNHVFESNLSEEYESLVTSFHRVQGLVPVEQELTAIPPEMRVSEALKLMQQEHYSQLPVVAGDAVLGVFSYRSFSTKAVAKQKSAKDPLGDLPVEDFLEEFEYIHPSEDWNRVLKYLNQDDAFFVGHRDGIEGMVTTTDLLEYFRDIANPFILIAEIEQSLRRIIQTCIDGEKLSNALESSLKTAYKGREVPTDLSAMTFDNFVQIISNNGNWPYFEQMFGHQPETRKRTEARLRQVGAWRNDVFHFRRPLDSWELNALSETREWLHTRGRAFEGRRRHSQKSILPESKQDRPTLDDFERLLTRRHLPDGQQQLYRALFNATEKGLSRDELVDVMGRRNRHDLAGVLGALGTRVNYTPGYGKTYKPGVEMVLIFQNTLDGEKLCLTPGMREALEALNPDWLNEDSGEEEML